MVLLLRHTEDPTYVIQFLMRVWNMKVFVYHLQELELGSGC